MCTVQIFTFAALWNLRKPALQYMVQIVRIDSSWGSLIYLIFLKQNTGQKVKMRQMLPTGWQSSTAFKLGKEKEKRNKRKEEWEPRDLNLGKHFKQMGLEMLFKKRDEAYVGKESLLQVGNRTRENTKNSKSELCSIDSARTVKKMKKRMTGPK